MTKKFPLHPKHPERICWGCDKYCPANDLQCGNSSGRTQHPAEMLGEDWYLWGDWGIENAPDPTAGESQGLGESLTETGNRLIQVRMRP